MVRQVPIFLLGSSVLNNKQIKAHLRTRRKYMSHIICGKQKYTSYDDPTDCEMIKVGLFNLKLMTCFDMHSQWNLMW